MMCAQQLAVMLANRYISPMEMDYGEKKKEKLLESIERTISSFFFLAQSYLLSQPVFGYFILERTAKV